MGQFTDFAGRVLRPARLAIVGFGPLAQLHCRYILSDHMCDPVNAPLLTVFPGICDGPVADWPPELQDDLFIQARKMASLLFVEESVSSIQPLPGRTDGGYLIETSQETYRFGNVYLEPANIDLADGAL